MHVPLAQDHMAWETAGPLWDRTQEHLASSDWAIVMFRELLKREIEKVQRGLDPIGVFRDGHPTIDTKLSEALTSGQYGGRRVKLIWSIKDEDRRDARVKNRTADIKQDLA